MNKRIGMIGVGKLGGPVSEVFAETYPTHTYDSNNTGNCNTIKECVEKSDIIFVAVPTPHDEKYDGKNVCSHLEPKNFDYSIVETVLEEANKYMNKDQILVLISTVLPGTTRKHFAPLVTNTNFVYNPYLIAMGTVKEDFTNPEMIMMGGDDKCLDEVEAIYKTVCNCDRYIRGTWEECESIKIFYNTFITTKITLCNMIQDVAMNLGNMNVDVVTSALAESTNRIMSPKYMKAGMGDGGSCHPRDNIALRWLAQDLNLGYDLFDTIIKAREVQAKNMADYLTTLSNKHSLPIVIVGKSFKPGLDYEDGSPSILVGQYCECDYDDFTSPAIYLLSHSHNTTYGTDNSEYTFPEGSVIVDPWREREGSIHYGNTRTT